MDNIPQDLNLGHGLAEPPQTQDQLNPVEEKLTGFALAIVESDNKWEMAKAWWEEQEKYFREQVAVELAGDDVNLEKVGQFQLVANICANKAEEFINWIEKNAEEGKRRRANSGSNQSRRTG